MILMRLFYLFHTCRIEYDAYRMDLENTKPEPTSPATEDAQKNFVKHKDNYENLRADVIVKMQFLDENRVSHYFYTLIKIKYMYFSIWKIVLLHIFACTYICIYI